MVGIETELYRRKRENLGAFFKSVLLLVWGPEKVEIGQNVEGGAGYCGVGVQRNEDRSKF